MRIISGEKRGTSFEAPKGLDTRPTLDRVKESVFGMLQFEIPNRTVLDLFAGSGNMGLEALSRYAKFAVFNDSSRESVAVIKKNVAKLSMEERSRVYCLDYRAAVARAAAEGYRFDIVFLDPPYEAGLGDGALKALLVAGVLLPGYTVVLEHSPKTTPTPPLGMRVFDCRRYGKVAVSIIREDK